MRLLLTMVLLLCCVELHAQVPVDLRKYESPYAGYWLSHYRNWQVHSSEDLMSVDFFAGGPQQTAPVKVELRIRPIPDQQKDFNLLQHGQLDSLWQVIRTYPQARIFRLDQRDAGSFQEIRYDYSYNVTLTDTARTRVVGRRVWRGGYEFRLEYRALATYTRRYYVEGRQIVNSFTLMPTGLPSRRYQDYVCDDKMYGIAALRINDGIWEDDCRTIHEFSVEDPSLPPVVHDQVLPFQSYALTKGFDNCLYSVTKAPTNRPELVYRYDPATRQGRYTHWKLPAQGFENIWISASTDERGDLFFISSDADQLVKVSPTTDSVTVVWRKDPVRRAPYYPEISFPGAGTHANFCLDNNQTMYQVYSTDGSLITIDLKTQEPAAELLNVDGLPERGGYSDLQFQYDAEGTRLLYLAGPKSLYQADLETHKAERVRKGVYTDLAGCNLYRNSHPAPPTPVATTQGTWKGRVLNALTYEPLPQAHMRLRDAQKVVPIRVNSQGFFSTSGEASYRFRAHVELPGYVSADTTVTLQPGPFVQDILLNPLALGSVLRLERVKFEQGQAVLLPTSIPDLNYLLELLRKFPQLSIELRGHTDNVGDPQKNVILSEQRVAVVKAYLVEHGIAPTRITGVGLGGSQPRASNSQESTRQLNRRVEFKVTGMQ